MKTSRSSLRVLAASLVTLVGSVFLYAFPEQRGSAGSNTEGMYRAAANSADAKFKFIETNGARPQPSQAPTVFSEREINSYIAAGYVRLPKGVERVRFAGAPNVVTTDGVVDFDKITEGARSSNPLLAVFSGKHDVHVVAHAEGSGGLGRVHIDSVSIDGVGVPRIALQFFADRYIKPKYPTLGLDSEFELPDRVDIAVVGNHILTVTQK